MPPNQKIRGVLFYQCPSVYVSFCPSVCQKLNVKTFNISLLLQNYRSHKTCDWYVSTCHWCASNEGHLSEVKAKFLPLSSTHLVNSLPKDKNLDLSKLKAFADDKIYVIEKLKFVLEMVENIVGKGDKADNQHFLLFPHCFQKASFSRSLKVGIV